MNHILAFAFILFIILILADDPSMKHDEQVAERYIAEGETVFGDEWNKLNGKQ